MDSAKLADKVTIDRRRTVVGSYPAWRWFFPLAALHAALVVPFSLLALYHRWDILSPLRLPVAHARELLFGFALAVIAGYLLGPLPQRRLQWLVGLWLMGRLGMFDWPLAPLATLADGAFALWVGYLLVPRFFAAKKWRNRILSPLLGLICLLAVVTLMWRYLYGTPPRVMVHQSVMWLALLMVFMGGRIIAPAVNGYLMSTFRQAGAGVRPRLEAALTTLLGLAPLLMPWTSLRLLAALLMLMAGLLVLWRIRGWRPWRCRARPDLLVLMIGYAWLGVGLLLQAYAGWASAYAGPALHAFTVGALGTLSATIMLRYVIMRAKQRPEGERALLPLAGLFAMATILRLWALEAGSAWLIMLWGSALLWSLAWLLVTWRLWHWLSRLPTVRSGRD